MLCIHCGYDIDEGDTFCEGCGQRVEEPKYVTCANCGQLLEDPDVFCDYCGSKLADAGGAYQQPAAVQPEFSAPYAQVSQQDTYQYQPAPQAPAHPRMPLIFLLDVSDSAAPHINQLIASLSQFVVDMCNDYETKKALDMAIIQFSDGYQVLDDLTDVANTRVSQLSTGGNVSFSAPIREAIRIAEDYARNQQQIFKPWIVMITSGRPSDDIDGVAGELQYMQTADKLRFMALGVEGYDAVSLKKLTDVVFRIKGVDFTSFFGWLGKCVSSIVRATPGAKPLLPSLEGNVYRDR